jgi:signal transduction histidine kinase
MPLVSDLNAYAADNQAMIERSRVQAGNLAHSLRTPLAVIIDEAERLSANPATRAPGRTLLSQSEVMVQQIEYHLAAPDRRRRPEAPSRPASSPRFWPVLNAMRKLHPGKTFATHAQDAFARGVAVDPVDLSELLSILLDNAGNGRDQAS